MQANPDLFGDDEARGGSTTPHTDTYHGRFVKLVTDEQVIEVVEFETSDPALRGEMTIAITLADVDGGTEILAVHDGLPPGLSTADNEVGWQEACPGSRAGHPVRRLRSAARGEPSPRWRRSTGRSRRRHPL